ncbi:MAG TPA: CpsB/CapC family capsule biosynthesis tyrosine phosphatase [Longimicrobiales bacterium]|nr:CpsB/CapC family capsule biosynthesis tyrosine phosphatase [Longimicrobiales bacterium]
MIDLHAHLMPGVDDGAADDAEAGAALAALRGAGYEAVTATPHLDASLVERAAAWDARLAAFDAAWERLCSLDEARMEGFTLHRGVELMLDVPEPTVDDRRVRLAGGSALLVEFPRIAVPPSMPAVLERLRSDGVLPVVAHPERYDVALAGGAAAWRAAGAALAVNGRALLGAYGPTIRKTAVELLARGLVDLIATDWHARGDHGATEVAKLLERSAGADATRLLTVENPRRLLQGSPAERPPAIRIAAGLGDRLRGFLGG